MDKLKELLGQLGGSKELTEAICEEFNNYTNRIKAKYENDFNVRVQRAKRICVEEVAKEKANLARKVAVFLESKANAIQQASTRQRAIEESEAKSLLRRTKALLEDISIGDDGAIRDVQAAQKKSERLEKAVATFKEERDQAIKRANKANEIATKALKQCNILEEKVKGIVAQKQVVTPPATLKENKTVPAVKPAPRRLDEGRIVPANAISTRNASQSKPSDTSSDKDPINTIASSINEIV